MYRFIVIEIFRVFLYHQVFPEPQAFLYYQHGLYICPKILRILLYMLADSLSPGFIFSRIELLVLRSAQATHSILLLAHISKASIRRISAVRTVQVSATYRRIKKQRIPAFAPSCLCIDMMAVLCYIRVDCVMAALPSYILHQISSSAPLLSDITAASPNI